MKSANFGSDQNSSRTAIPIPLTQGPSANVLPFDPRQAMDEGALVEASRLAYPAVTARRSRKDGMGLAAGGAVALILGAVTFWSLNSGREQDPAALPPPEASRASQVAPVLPQEGQGLTFRPDGAVGEAPSLVFSSPPNPQGLTIVGSSERVDPGPSALAQRFRSPSLVVDSSGPVIRPSPEAAAEPAQQSQAASGAPAGGDDFAARVDASANDSATAVRMSDPSGTVSQGTLIPAVLETAINSDLPGYVRAVVSQDVRSFDGKNILIPRSSRLIGQYRSGLSAGQTRAYVLWSRLIRPDGVSVAIASPATDEAGRSGLAGEVESHFFKRFGSALLLSVVGAAAAIGTGGASLLVPGGGGAAGVAAQQNGSIPPTVRVRQGQPIRVFTARDLNFSSVSGSSRS